MKRLLPIILVLCLLCSAAVAAEAGCWRLEDDEMGGAMGITFIRLPAVHEEGRAMALWPSENVTDVTLTWLDWIDMENPAETVLWQGDTLASNQVLVITASLGDVMPDLRVTCVNAQGDAECWYITDSGEDGSLLLISDEEFALWMYGPAEPVYPEVQGGVLISAGYDCSGDELGNLFRAEIQYTEDRTPVLVVQESEWYDQPVTVSRYSCGEDVLERIAVLVRENDMLSWADRPDWLTVCDAAYPELLLTVMDEDAGIHTYAISAYIRFTTEESEAWHQVHDILMESRKPQYLIETYTCDME